MEGWEIKMAEKKEIKMVRSEYEKLSEELEYLRNDKSKEIAERLNQAREYGDLSENAEYDAAKIEQSENFEKAKAIEEMLKNAIIIDEDKIDYSTVNIGAKVTVHDYQLKEDVTYLITGQAGYDPFNNKISDDSPVGKALISKKTGATVVADTPSGPIKMKILKIDRSK